MDVISCLFLSLVLCALNFGVSGSYSFPPSVVSLLIEYQPRSFSSGPSKSPVPPDVRHGFALLCLTVEMHFEVDSALGSDSAHPWMKWSKTERGDSQKQETRVYGKAEPCLTSAGKAVAEPVQITRVNTRLKSTKQGLISPSSKTKDQRPKTTLHCPSCHLILVYAIRNPCRSAFLCDALPGRAHIIAMLQP